MNLRISVGEISTPENLRACFILNFVSTDCFLIYCYYYLNSTISIKNKTKTYCHVLYLILCFCFKVLKVNTSMIIFVSFKLRTLKINVSVCSVELLQNRKKRSRIIQFNRRPKKGTERMQFGMSTFCSGYSPSRPFFNLK